MNELLKYFVVILKKKTATLKKKGILIEKPWALLDDDGAIQKLIFKKDGGLVLSKNGQVTGGSWEYFSEAYALLIDRGQDKLLLKEQYIDENVLILKKDGTDNDFFALANENTLPDYNVSKYLNDLKRREFKIVESRLLDGKVAQIYNGREIVRLEDYRGLKVDVLKKYDGESESSNGTFLSEDKAYTFVIKEGKIISVKKNLIKVLKDGSSFEIEDGSAHYNVGNKDKNATINGKPIVDARLVDSESYIYEIRNSRILNIFVINEYSLSSGAKIKIEQKRFSRITKGDKIIASEISPLPNGSYRLKGQLFKVRVENNVIV